ncbi:MAG: SAM-dependent chlorinase/fluorinase [Flavobacteriaceae bacterium]|nr:SAM-dependent chlorinase/fluorinase [Flavobacteriaceae bacterium]
MPTLTLTTDYGEKDHYVGAVKGAIYARMPTARIVDITHSVSPFHTPEAAYIIRNAFPFFPSGTIHIIGIDTERTPLQQHLLVCLKNHFFICTDNGIISLIASEHKPEKIIEIEHPKSKHSSFPVLDVFVDIAVALSEGKNPDTFGNQTHEIKQLRSFSPVVKMDGKQIIGTVIYIDNYGNVICNITRSFFEQEAKGRSFLITARSAKFSKIQDNYSDMVNFSDEHDQRFKEGNKLALFNHAGFLEIAIYKGNPNTSGGASSLLGLDYSDTITVDFLD